MPSHHLPINREVLTRWTVAPFPELKGSNARLGRVRPPVAGMSSPGQADLSLKTTRPCSLRTTDVLRRSVRGKILDCGMLQRPWLAETKYTSLWEGFPDGPLNGVPIGLRG